MDGQNDRKHPEPEELLDYHLGDLSPEDRERIQDHLVLCQECSRTVLDLDAFPDVEPAREEDRLSDFELAAEWRRFRERTGAKPVRRAASSRLPYALAAALLLAAIGLSLWTARLLERVRELSGPRADVHVADLVPLGIGVRGPEAAEEVRVPDWAGRVLLILNLAGAKPYPEYEIRVLDPSGSEVWSLRGVRPGPDGTFALEAPADLLGGGAHEIRLLGLGARGAEPVARYGVRLEPE